MAEFRILGPLEVENAGNPVPLRGATQRVVLAFLLLHANEVVRREQLVDGLWGDRPPDTATKMVQNAVSQLRKSLGPDSGLVTSAGGYLLRVEPAQLDAARFERLLADANEAAAGGAAAAAAGLLREALALWHGPPLADFAYDSFAQTEIVRLEDLRLAAIEQRIELDLALGRHAELVPELEALVAQHPLREAFHAQLMLALYRGGRQAQALELYRVVRSRFADELGLEPGPALQRLERAILEQDPSLEVAPQAAPREPAPVPVRPALKTVTAVCVAYAAPELDPEAYAQLEALVADALARPFEAAGGRVDTESTGHLLATFGVPVVREDDALRAVDAAARARGALADLQAEALRRWGSRIGVRIGVATGEVLADAGPLGGSVFARAAQLAHAAADGEILVGPATERRVRDAARLEPAAAAPAWRLVDVARGATAIPRRLDAPLVGRSWELGQLQQAFERAVETRTSYLVTVLGPAGIGKSRLTREFAASLAPAATVLTARCVSYGEGITFLPLAELVRAAAGGTSREAVAAVLEGDAEADAVAARIVGALGGGEDAGSTVEVFWAARRFFAALARSRPLVLVVEDIHWAEPTLLDLVDHVVDGTRDAPILALCLARPELLEERPTWGGGKLNAASLLLEPLSDEHCRVVIENAGGGGLVVAPRIAEAAEGNPLFLEQMVALALEGGGEEVAVPPTIQALLAARVDRLESADRVVLECASVVGREFTAADVAALAVVGSDNIAESLDRLARRELVARPAFDGPHRFRHALIRDAAYAALPREVRAELHEQYAAYLERTRRADAEREEIVGYHLEQSYRSRRAAGVYDAHVRSVGRRAAELLARAGRRAYAAGDVPGTVALLARATEVLDEDDDERVALLPDLGEALRESGDYPSAEEVLAAAIDAAAARGDRALEAYARMIRLRMRVQTDTQLDVDDLHVEARRAAAVFEAGGDERRLAKAWELIAWGSWIRCQAAATEAALERSMRLARSCGDSRTEAQSLHLFLGATLFGPVPVPRGIARCNEILAAPDVQKRVAASALRALAGLKAMEGSFGDARELMARFQEIVEDLGLRVTVASASETYGVIELLAGDAEAAERELRVGYDTLERLGVTSTRANVAALLAQALCAQGRAREALALAELGEDGPAADDLSAQVHWRVARAGVLSRLGRRAEAEEAALAAVALARETDFLAMHGDALVALADVLVRGGRAGEAAPVVDEAVALYERKGNVVGAGRARAVLREVAPRPA